MGINGPSLGSLADVLWHYTVTFSNHTTDVFDEVIIFYSTTDGSLKNVRKTDVQPNDRLVFDLGECKDMVEYNLGVFIGTSLVARFPDMGSMNRQLASQINPTDHFLCEDSWLIE